MLTRLKVSGFKNLNETEVHFGPFTCIEGQNGVGKSNIFDAIHFLSLLADNSFAKAAEQTRSGRRIQDIFTRGGDGRMSFSLDVIIPKTGQDDFQQPAQASHSFLNYELELALETPPSGPQRIALLSEELSYITLGDAKERLGFPFGPEWRDSVLSKSSRRSKYIDTRLEGKERRIRLSTDKMPREGGHKRGGGRPRDFVAETLPRTVLSAAANADESRTAVLLRQELRSWRMLQLEPSALRRADELSAPSDLSTSGAHLAATLYRLQTGPGGDRVLAQIANRLSELIDDVDELLVVRDDTRQLLELRLKTGAGHEFAASSLSDGTLRFVALSVLEQDPTATGLICLEEPENGIHPERMSAMLRLLNDMATDPELPSAEDNPLRQVIISTHSPLIGERLIHEFNRGEDLLFASHQDHELPSGDQFCCSGYEQLSSWRPLSRPTAGSGVSAS